MNDNKTITSFFQKKTDNDEDEENGKVSPPQKRQRPIDEVLQDLIPRSGSLFDPNAPTSVTIVPKADLPDIAELNTPSDILNFKCERNKDGSLLMYWLDATEIGCQLFLFGKVREFQSDKFISCCVVVPKLWRQCYLLLPDEEVDPDVLQEQITRFAKSNSIAGNYRYKVVTKQYCFEEPGVPYGEHKYVELLYPLWEGDVSDHPNFLTF
jgi:hypothetical protein